MRLPALQFFAPQLQSISNSVRPLLGPPEAQARGASRPGSRQPQGSPIRLPSLGGQPGSVWFRTSQERHSLHSGQVSGSRTGRLIPDPVTPRQPEVLPQPWALRALPEREHTRWSFAVRPPRPLVSRMSESRRENPDTPPLTAAQTHRRGSARGSHLTRDGLRAGDALHAGTRQEAGLQVAGRLALPAPDASLPRRPRFLVNAGDRTGGHGISRPSGQVACLRPQARHVRNVTLLLVPCHFIHTPQNGH